MRLGTLRIDGRHEAALVHEGEAARISDLEAVTGEAVGAGDVTSLLHGWAHHIDALRRLAAALAAGAPVRRHPLTDLWAPLPRPGKILAIGRNYADHAAETGHEVPPEPMIFVKHTTSVVGPFADVVRPAFVDDLDYEAELAVVIGTAARDVSEAEALTHVAGYMCANDVSARTAQMATGQFVRGKSFDTFCPLGPVLVTADEIPDPQSLRIQCRVDGTVMQDDTTANMIVSVARLVSHCSAATTLEAGDVILTGTPAGVALGRTPPPWLQPGQVCEVEVEGIGVLRNRIVG
ncbi:MAG: fumarylacetoacetate hydrolase family protein [Candidatus Dormibacteria bacterium]